MAGGLESMSEVTGYKSDLWDTIAADPATLNAFLEEFAGLRFDLQLNRIQTTEEWIAETVKAWTYRPPISAHLIDNRASGPPVVFFGPGPGGRAARQLVEIILGRAPSELRARDATRGIDITS